MLLDHLRHNLFDRFCNRLLNCYLEVLLGLYQLLQGIHLHVQVCKFLRKLLKVVNQQFLLAFAGLRHIHVDLRLLICILGRYFLHCILLLLDFRGSYLHHLLRLLWFVSLL